MSAHVDIRDDRRPIKSAEAVAALRAVSAWETPAADDYAPLFVGGWYSLLLALPKRLSKPLTERITPGSYAFFLARTRFMDEWLTRTLDKEQVEQVLILGAGYDSRAHRIGTRFPQTRFFEVDLPGTQSEKLRRLATSDRPLNRTVTYVPVDLAKASLQAALAAAGFVFHRKTVVVWEGVSYYLPEPAVAGVFDFTSNLLASGSVVLFDYALRSFVDGDASLYGGPAMQRWLRKNNEPFRFGLDPKDAAARLESWGLEVLEDLGTEQICERFLLRADGSALGKPFGHLRLVAARTLGNQNGRNTTWYCR